MDRNKLLAMTPHQRAAYDRARVVPDDTFLQEKDLQGPQPMPRNYLADLAREYWMPSISDRLNSPTSGIGMLVDAVGGLGNALVVQPAQSFNRLLQQGYEPGNPQSAEDAFNVAGAAMVGGLAAPRPKAVATAERIGMSGRPDGTEPIKGYRGSAWGSSVAPSFNREPIYWASSNPELAADYAAHSFGRAGPSVTPAEFRFRNPLEIDADGAGWQQIPYGGKTSITDKVAMDARKAGHDGVVFRNVVDDVNGNMTAADTIAALQPGTVYSPLTGELLYANGGKQGAAVGAATSAPQDNRDLKSILDKYGLGHLLQPTDWARRMQPGDA